VSRLPPARRRPLSRPPRQPRSARRSRASFWAERIIASGFASPFPAMSGAEPCTGSNIKDSRTRTRAVLSVTSSAAATSGYDHMQNPRPLIGDGHRSRSLESTI
jgi:hypothetical protein